MLAFPPLDAAVGVAHAALSLLTAVTGAIAGPHATALAIVALTIAVRLLASPLTYLQVRAERNRAALAPRLRELRSRCDDPARLQAETMALYRSEGVNPAAGCLPALLQAPLFLVMFRLATNPPPGSDLLAATLFGVPLGYQLGAAVLTGLAGATIPVFAGLLALLAVLAWWLSRRMRRAAVSDGPPALARVMPLLPYATVVAAAVLPLAAGLYLLATTGWTALEHATLRRTAPAATAG